MAVPRKLLVVPNAATRELWRIAECGELGELDEVLTRADINARNEHGMTALMRAARHGRVATVRVLLDHGADPNLTRNDNFTALSLAAFFGHAEIVDILLQHGAKTDVATRFGTSPYIWARARSYGDVARSLEKRAVDPTQSATPASPARMPLPSSSTPVPTAPLPSVSPEDETTPIVVRTLKDPPEIWDLVHEAPRNFNARSAFLTRIGSRKGAVVAAAALILVVGAGSAGAVFFKDKLRWPSPQAPAPKAAAATVPGPVVKKTATQTDATVPTANPAAPTDVAPEASGATEPPSVIVGAELNTFPGNRRLRSRSSSMASTVNDEQPAVGTSVAPPTVASPKPAARLSAETDPKKQTAPANSQVVAPPKMAPPKGKVIQWP